MSSAGTNNGKDVIYIDVDDEITSLIEKVRSSKQKIVALVLPKRATVLQSIVNMKLLKRSADESKKNLVLITSEAGLLPLAGTVGLHVARSLQSKPEVPDGPGKIYDKPDTIDEPDIDDTADDDTPEPIRPVDKSKTVGELAGSAVMGREAEADDEDGDTIELGDEDESEDDEETPIVLDGKAATGKNKKLKIPNFNKFRVLLLVGGLGIIALIVLLFMALSVLPKASVVIKTDSTAITSNTTLSLKTDPATGLDVKTGLLLATSQQTQKTQMQQVPATGQQNNGQKASGAVNMAAKICGTPSTPNDVPAGSGVSANNLTFITQSNTSFTVDHIAGGCIYFKAAATPVTAQQGGAQYNIGAGTFTVAGRSDITATSSSAMSGGTDDITKVITQADIDSAKQKISALEIDPIKQTLKTSLIAKGLYAIDTTFNTGTPDVKTSANVGDKADTVTVTEVITYTMLGVHESDLQKIIANDVKSKIDPNKQSILEYGLDNPSFTLQNQDANGATLAMQATAIAGPELKVGTIKTQIAGKKAGDATAIIKANPGVTDVNVSYSPFWVSSIPKKTTKITVTIEKPTKTTSTNNATTTP
ncbi:MAG TPA: hypothetical protein VLI54_03435 [Bacillota bacterium]|nr:hypothetical protein [Bacillota bacterium]